MSVAAAYGILHDLITAHVCVEYFTIGHPRIVDSESPLVLALVWGVVAMWAVFAAALVAALRRRPGLRPIAWRLCHVGLVSVVALGGVAWVCN